MSQRYYIKNYGDCWSLSKTGYLKLLEAGAANAGWDLSRPQYEARAVKRLPVRSKAIDVTDFSKEHYQEELKYFLETGGQTGFAAPKDFIRGFEQ